MATETTVRVTCDRCHESHYHGPKRGRPEHIHMTFWSGCSPEWDPGDLCKKCANEFKALLDGFACRIEGDATDDDC